jgi:hypothetical protein
MLDGGHVGSVRNLVFVKNVPTELEHPEAHRKQVFVRKPLQPLVAVVLDSVRIKCLPGFFGVDPKASH